MRLKFLILAISSLAMIQCTCQKNVSETKMYSTKSKEVNATYPTKKPENGVTRLVENQNIFLEKEKVNITFNKVTEDSRCPMNARCIAAGFAKLEIVVMSLHSRPTKIEISTENNAEKNLTNFFEFGGHKFTLVNLYPANSTDVGLEELQGKYVVDIKVE